MERRFKMLQNKLGFQVDDRITAKDLYESSLKCGNEFVINTLIEINIIEEVDDPFIEFDRVERLYPGDLIFYVKLTGDNKVHAGSIELTEQIIESDQDCSMKVFYNESDQQAFLKRIAYNDDVLSEWKNEIINQSLIASYFQDLK
jgi:hypothetical protein